MRRLPLLAVLLLTFVLPARAVAQENGELPSVSLRPASTTTSDPNGGRWFVGEGTPGERLEFGVVVTNPARAEQRVNLYLVDLTVAKDGTPILGDRASGLASWGAFETPEIVVPPLEERRARFTVTVPQGAEPGDHLAAVVAESASTGANDVQVVKRIANRFYVTVPGDVSAGLELVSVDIDPERAVLPRWARVTVILRNTGGVRLQPTVKVAGAEAAGSELLMSQSVESYVVRKRLPVWGGTVDFDVDVRTRVGDRAGPAAQGSGSAFVFPLLVLLVILLLVLGALSARRLPRRRDRVEELAAELRRLENELTTRERV